MTSHLSSEQISRLLAGDATTEQSHHASTCAECAAEVRQMQDVLSAFRASVQQWSHTIGGYAVVLDQPFLLREPRSFRVRPLRWALAAALIIILTTVPVYRNATERQRQAEALHDSILLEQVNAQLSRSVSAPMEPLMKLVSSSSVNEIGGRQ